MDKLFGTQVAIKHFYRLFHSFRDTLRILKEITILSKLHHPCIAELYHVIPPENPESFLSFQIVMEYLPTDLRKLINSGTILSIAQVKSFMYQLLCGLNYMHSAGVVHRDIKPGNLLVSDDYHLKICDFNLATTISATLESAPDCPEKIEVRLDNPLTEHVATRWYRAPELILISPFYDGKVDVWGAGCVFGELLGTLLDSKWKGPLFPGGSCYPLSSLNEYSQEKCDENDEMVTILKFIGSPSGADLAFIDDQRKYQYMRNFPQYSPISTEKIFPGAGKEAIDLLKKMIEFNPDKRISVEEALAHNFFKGVRNCKIEKGMVKVIDLELEQAKLCTNEGLRREIVKRVELINKQ
eukprot:TRINITY_DN88533_c0_g1_i1.p1 TRINITY_DN88533_c0_g1~~TRINITY_DN88533_c0_g1_i1.p1  ORF type:complete len:354 (+),score=25.86 TRINITY_DN88533_c0_g1_i1:1887-2948(+)